MIRIAYPYSNVNILTCGKLKTPFLGIFCYKILDHSKSTKSDLVKPKTARKSCFYRRLGHSIHSTSAGNLGLEPDF